MKVVDFITELGKQGKYNPVCVLAAPPKVFSPTIEYRNINVETDGNDLVIVGLNGHESYPPPFTNVACLLSLCTKLKKKYNGNVKIKILSTDDRYCVTPPVDGIKDYVLYSCIYP